MKAEKIVALALAGHPNHQISTITGTRPRRIREIVGAAIQTVVPIALYSQKVASSGKAGVESS